MEHGPMCLPGLVNRATSEDTEAGVTPRAEGGPGRVGLLLLQAIPQLCPRSEGDTHSWGPVSLEEAQPGARDQQRL